MSALKNALMVRQPDPGLYFHSDQGSQYSSQAVQKPLAVIGVREEISSQRHPRAGIQMDTHHLRLLERPQPL
jgi:transposase InsO family protein